MSAKPEEKIIEEMDFQELLNEYTGICSKAGRGDGRCLLEARCLSKELTRRHNALAARVKKLEAQLADYESAYAATLNSPCDDEKHCTCVPHLRRRIGGLEAEVAGLTNARDAYKGQIQELHGHVAELCKMTGTMLGSDAPDSWTLAECVRRLKSRVAELEAGGNDELTAAWMAGRESAKDEVAALKAELNGLRALCNEAATFAESHGVIWTVELLSRLRAAIQDRTIDPAGGHDA